ncbi:hypothetical protein Syun_016233 [Stephania yunnanensis]|uniref:Uncharacterized protein n=1 Tax=Stephania yunnanensis TaxID=152371 RepID=A0AAP0P4P2_9MAGN
MEESHPCNQLQTLPDPSIYAGNQGLCGAPLKDCATHPDIHGLNHEEDKEEWLPFFISMSIGFVEVKSEMVEGISPESWFLDKSSDSNRRKDPIFSGIFPVKEFADKFKILSPSRFVNFIGIAPDR